MTDADPLDPMARENRALADLARLSVSGHPYTETVRLVLNVVEQAVSSPLLCLSVEEIGEIGHYARAQSGTDPLWAEDTGRSIAAAHEQLLLSAHPSAPRMPPAIITPAKASVSFRPGRAPVDRSILTLASPEGLNLTPEDDRLMRRLVDQAALVLDHALLLAQIESLEPTDRLTGVANHQRLMEVLDYELKRRRYFDRWLALLLLDIEGLDGINRSYGRQYGNHILKKLAALVTETVRPIDVVARYGLDELAVVLPEADEDVAEEIVERVRDRLLAVEFAGGEVGVTVAAAQARPGEALTPESFLLRAEACLEDAKRQQRELGVLLRSGGTRKC